MVGALCAVVLHLDAYDALQNSQVLLAALLHSGPLWHYFYVTYEHYFVLKRSDLVYKVTFSSFCVALISLRVPLTPGSLRLALGT